jgi:hypothetical protein
VSQVTVADPLAPMDDAGARAAGWLIALACVALLPSLFAPFIADDYFHVWVASQSREALTRGWVLPIGQAGTWWTPPDLAVEYFRPLVVVSFVVDWFLYGASAFGCHLTNLALHAAATLTAWGIARRILGAGFGAWAAAALFAVHPCHVEGVAWISGRTDVLSALLYMAALLLYFKSRERPRASAALVVLSLMVFFLALMAKEMAATFPVILLVHNLLRPEGRALGRRLVVPGLAAALVGLYLALRIHALGGFHTPPAPFAYHLGDGDLLGHLVIAPILYLGDMTLFVPGDPMVTVPFWTSHPFLLAVFAAIVLATFLGALRRAITSPAHLGSAASPPAHLGAAGGRDTLTWGLAFMGVTLLPVAMLPIAEHFLYLPSLGYCILLGSALPRSVTRLGARDRRGLVFIGWFVLAVCIGRTVVFTRVAYASKRAIEQAVAAFDHFPATKLLLVADLPAGASLGFGLAMHFVRPSVSADVEILSILPALTAGGAERSLVRVSLPDRVELRRDGGFLHSYVERALSGPRTSFRPGEVFARKGYEVTVLDAPRGELHAFESRLFDPVHTLVLSESDRGLVPLLPNPSPSAIPAAVPTLTQAPSSFPP